MINITDNQRAVLHAAALSANLAAWPVPHTLRLSKGSATIMVKGLLKKGLVEERAALGNDPIWREDKEGKHLTLVISKAGMGAIGVTPSDRADQKGGVAQPDLAAPSIPATGPRRPRADSKLAMLVEMLSREQYTTVDEMAAATGWQAHTVRGVMSGALRKKFGLRIASMKVQRRGRVYRVEKG